MTTYAVRIIVEGPFRDAADGQRFVGAYSNRFVSASDEYSAEERAVAALNEEQQFLRLERERGIGAPEIKIESIRKASWIEGLSSNEALVLCRDKPPAPG